MKIKIWGGEHIFLMMLAIMIAQCWLCILLLSTEAGQYTWMLATEKKADVCQASGSSESNAVSPADEQIEVMMIDKGKGFTKILSERHLV